MAARSAATTGAAPCCAAWPATTRWSTRSGTATRAAGPSPTPRAADRLTHPLVRDAETGELRVASWPEALDVAARGLAAAKAQGGVGVLVGGRVTLEDAYAYAKFARIALRTNDIDFRARPHSAEEAAFLGSARRRAASRTAGPSPTPTSRTPPPCCSSGFEPEEESPIVFLRLRKAVRAHGTGGRGVAPWATRGLTKLAGRLVPAAPGTEAEVLRAIGNGGRRGEGRRRPLGRRGRRACWSASGWRPCRARCPPRPRWPAATGARLAWVPRRAGERGAAGGRRPAQPAARRPSGRATLRPGSTCRRPGRRRTSRPRRAATPRASSRRPRSGELGGLGRRRGRPGRPDRPAGGARGRSTPAVRRLARDPRERRSPQRPTSSCRWPPPEEKGGTFVDWEGRRRPFATRRCAPTR